MSDNMPGFDLDKALAFLKQHQPLPPDNELSEELIAAYDEVRKFFLHNPDPRCVPLFLNSFGYIGGFGVYQLVEDVLVQFPPEVVVPHLKTALNSPHYSVCYWSVQIAAHFPSVELLRPLKNLLFFQPNFDLKCYALAALSETNFLETKNILTEFISTESDEKLTDFAREVLFLFS